MTQRFNVHPTNPQKRLLQQIVALLDQGGVVAMPTDARYLLVAAVNQYQAHQHIRNLRHLDPQHLLSLICCDFRQISEYAQMDNDVFRLLKNILPGAYTVILKGTKHLGKKLSHPKRKTVGVRIPNHQIVVEVIQLLGMPLIAATLEAQNEEPLEFIDDICKQYQGKIAAIVDCGETHSSETTILILCGA